MDTENNIYEPVEPTYYNYKFTENFEQNIDDQLEYCNLSQIKICAYEINTEAKYPFLKYLLYKDIFSEKDVLSFPAIDNSFFHMNTQNVKNFAQLHLFGILELTDYETFSKSIQYKGCYIYNNDVYVFFDITKNNVILYDIYRKSPTWLCLIDEIINERNVCSFKVRSDVSDFFIENHELCFLKDKNDDSYALPVVGYVGKPENMLNFTYIFGESKRDNHSIMGPYYYFTNYSNAIKHSGWSRNEMPETNENILLTENKYGKYIKNGGIVRFALFLNKMKFIENFPNDDIDESGIKQERLNDPNLDVNYERLTMRISDHDGNWTNIYNSVYLGRTELDNGEILKDTPIIVLKNYEQQCPLSYHFIDKSCLGDKYDELKSYFIL